MSVIHLAGLDVEQRDEERFSHWYCEQHLPRMLSQRGWRGARRYECLEGEPRFVTIYDLDDEALGAVDIRGALSSTGLRAHRDPRLPRPHLPEDP